jgi:large subunit ribosomal protein L6
MAKKTNKIKITMQEIEIPSGIEVKIEGNTIIIKKEGKEAKRIADREIEMKQEGSRLIISMKRNRREQKRKIGTFAGHIKNMIDGLLNGFEYDLEICNVHFPMTLTFDKAKNEFIIKNLLGEKAPRILKINGNIEVEIKAPHVKIKSHDIETAGQAAANLEKLARIRNRDRNKFQDGIFITKKPGRSYL